MGFSSFVGWIDFLHDGECDGSVSVAMVDLFAANGRYPWSLFGIQRLNVLRHISVNKVDEFHSSG